MVKSAWPSFARASSFDRDWGSWFQSCSIQLLIQYCKPFHWHRPNLISLPLCWPNLICLPLLFLLVSPSSLIIMVRYSCWLHQERHSPLLCYSDSISEKENWFSQDPQDQSTRSDRVWTFFIGHHLPQNWLKWPIYTPVFKDPTEREHRAITANSSPIGPMKFSQGRKATASCCWGSCWFGMQSTRRPRNVASTP